MLRTISLLLVFGLTGGYAIADENWTLITTGDTKIFEARIGSLQHVYTGLGEPAAIILCRVIDIATKNVKFARYYVRFADCRAGFGKVGEADLSNRALSEADFVFDGGNVASAIAQTICIGADLQDQEIRMKIVPKGDQV